MLYFCCSLLLWSFEVKLMIMCCLQERWMSRAVLESSEDIVFLTHKQPPLLPRVLQLQRLEVVTQAAFSCADHRDQTEVGQLVGRVDWAVFSLQNHRHVELLHHEINNFARRCSWWHVELETGASRQACVIGCVHLPRKWTNCHLFFDLIQVFQLAT